MSITFPLTIKIIYEPEAKSARYVAYNPELDIASCGKNEEEARRMLEEAIRILLQGAREDGTLDQILEEAGFLKKGKEFIPPKTYFSSFTYNFT
ncbi:MAG: type II toxin-antitoxin system HicB family antitoxin [Microgenomates group bacterium]